MFTVIYSFEIRPSLKADFEKSWKDMTNLIYEHCGSLGSRLHQESDSKYVAYAQWPNKQTWAKSSDKLPKSADAISKVMKESCYKIERLFELNVVDDLLKNKTS